MSFGINLRFDLKKLSDAQLANLLEQAWQRHDAAKARQSLWDLQYSSRGFIRHPLAYPFISVLRYGTGFLFTMGLAISYSLDSLISPSSRAVMQMHLALCDIADVMDELGRRMKQPRASCVKSLPD